MTSESSGFHLHTPDLRKTGSDMRAFSDRLSEHSTRMQDVGGSVSRHSRRDRSGVGAKIAKLTDKATSVFRKFLGETSRVTGQSGKNLHAGADAAEETEQANFLALKNLHSDPHPPKLGTIEEEPRVRFDDAAKKNDGGTAYKPPTGAVPGQTPPARTGAGTGHLTGPPQPGTHPLRTGLNGADEPHIAQVSSQQAHDIRTSTDFGRRTRPGMASALHAGDTTIPHSSMKTGTPNRHPVVQQVLDELATRGPDGQVQPTGIGPAGKGHGRCAEVGSISDYLHRADPAGNWSIQDARNHFEHVGGATSAHRPSGQQALETPPCESCSYLTHRLGISTLSPRTEPDSPVELQRFPWDRRDSSPS